MNEGESRAASGTRGLTVPELADHYDVTPGQIYQEWVRAPDFPRPVGYRPRVGTGGTPLAEFDPREVGRWHAHQPGLQPPPQIVFEGSLELVAPLGTLARRMTVHCRPVAAKTVSQYRHHPDFPDPVPNESSRECFRAGDVVDFMNRRPGKGNRTRGSSRAGRPGDGAGPRP